MVIKKKPEKEEIIDENVRIKIIEKAQAKESDVHEVKQWVNICLRITRNLISSIDSDLKTRIGISRNAWILEAIQEKIKKENQSDHLDI